MLFSRCYGQSCAGVKLPIAFLRFTGRTTAFGQVDHLYQPNGIAKRQGKHVARRNGAAGAQDALSVHADMTFVDQLASRAACSHEPQATQQAVDPHSGSLLDEVGEAGKGAALAHRLAAGRFLALLLAPRRAPFPAVGPWRTEHTLCQRSCALDAKTRLAEKAFGVHVLAVRTANMKGGTRYVRGTRRAVKESTWKKAIVTVKEGERIELA